MDSNAKAYAKVLQETFPNFSKIDIENVANTVKQKLEKETLFNRFFYHIEAARKEGGNHNRLRELVMIFIDKCMINGFEPYSLDLPEALDDRTLFLSNIIYEAYKTHWITPSRTEEAVKLESEAIEDFDREAWNILKTLGEIDRPYFQKIKNSKFSSGVEIITTKESYIRYILSKSWYGQTYTVGDCVKSASEWGLTPDDVPQIVAELNSRRAALDTRDKAWGRMQNHTKPLIAKTCVNNLLSTQLSGVNSLKTGTSNSDISIPITPNSQSIFYAILEIFAGFLILVGHILTIVVFVIPYILLADLWDSWILSILVGSIFWIIIAYILASIPWKSLKPTRNWILSPIRALRRLLRRLEESTRP